MSRWLSDSFLTKLRTVIGFTEGENGETDPAIRLPNLGANGSGVWGETNAAGSLHTLPVRSSSTGDVSKESNIDFAREADKHDDSSHSNYDSADMDSVDSSISRSAIISNNGTEEKNTSDPAKPRTNPDDSVVDVGTLNDSLGENQQNGLSNANNTLRSSTPEGEQEQEKLEEPNNAHDNTLENGHQEEKGSEIEDLPNISGEKSLSSDEQKGLALSNGDFHVDIGSKDDDEDDDEIRPASPPHRHSIERKPKLLLTDPPGHFLKKPLPDDYIDLKFDDDNQHNNSNLSQIFPTNISPIRTSRGVHQIGNVSFSMPEGMTLHQACEIGDLNAVMVLCSQKARCDILDDLGQCPLYIACKKGFLEIAQYLVERAKADVNELKDPHIPDPESGASPLTAAAYNGHFDVVSYLLKNPKTRVNHPQDDGATPLLLACLAGHISIVKMLHQAGASINQTMRVNSATPLAAAAMGGHSGIVKYLCQSGASVSIPTINGETPLFAACQIGNYEIADILIDFGAAVNACRDDGASPLHIACLKGHVGIIELLISNECVVDRLASFGVTPLMMAVQSSHITAVKSCVEAGASVQHKTVDGRTPLWIACQLGHIEIAKYLHDKSEAEINVGMKTHATPLWIASQNGHVNIVHWLLEVGASVDQTDNNGQTPFFIACQNGFLEVARELVTVGNANATQSRPDGATPISCAAFNGHQHILEWLIQSQELNPAGGAGGSAPLMLACQQGHLNVVRCLIGHQPGLLNLRTQKGTTPLWIAAKNGHLNVVKWLVEVAKADVDTPMNQGATPLYVACRMLHVEVAKYLLKAGKADPHAACEDGTTPYVIAQRLELLQLVDIMDNPPDMEAEGEEIRSRVASFRSRPRHVSIKI